MKWPNSWMFFITVCLSVFFFFFFFCEIIIYVYFHIAWGSVKIWHYISSADAFQIISKPDQFTLGPVRDKFYNNVSNRRLFTVLTVFSVSFIVSVLSCFPTLWDLLMSLTPPPFFFCPYSSSYIQCYCVSVLIHTHRYFWDPDTVGPGILFKIINSLFILCDSFIAFFQLSLTNFCSSSQEQQLVHPSFLTHFWGFLVLLWIN